MRFVRPTLFIIALALAACERCDGCSSESADSVTEGRAEPTLIEHGDLARSDAEAPPAIAPPSDGTRDRDKVARAFESFAEGLKMIAEAMVAGIDAERGDTHCERALTGMTGMIKHIAERTPEGRTPPSPPNGLLFMQLCEGLEVEAQRCLVLSYRKDHERECEQLRERMPPDVVERIDRMLSLR
jgi:hypothetical protein